LTLNSDFVGFSERSAGQGHRLGKANDDTLDTHYAKSGDVHIAYQVMGAGPLDLVVVPGFVSHLDLQMENPAPVRLYERLASFSRLIRFDKRGTGLSDRMGSLPTLEERMDDVRAVMDATGSKKAALLGVGQ
jgi:pimeloyl-ACP methyl ester carboxylesterase